MTIGRPLEFDPDLSMAQAMLVFWRKGYEATSLQDLLAAMGLSKSSFYQAFHSKHALFQRCLRLYRGEILAEMRAKLAAAGSGRAFLAALLHGVADETHGRRARIGCLLMNTAAEFAQADAEIAAEVAGAFRATTDLFEEAVRQGQAQGEISTERDARTLASYVLTNMGGLRNMVKAGADGETVRRVADITLSALD